MEIIYLDNDIVVCVKPARVLSTDEAGGLPELLRLELGDERAELRTVHRLDRVVGGLMVLARSASAAGELSAQIRDGRFQKRYAAVVHGDPGPAGTMRDLLYRDKARRMTFVTDTPGKEAREAVLEYERLWSAQGMSRVDVRLITGRTHQIRCQFASRGFPLVGERKYSLLQDPCQIALWSAGLSFYHPATGRELGFSAQPNGSWPWNCGG